MLPALLVSLRIQLMKPELAMPNNMMAGVWEKKHYYYYYYHNER